MKRFVLTAVVLLSIALTVPTGATNLQTQAPANQLLPGSDCPWAVRIVFTDRDQLRELGSWLDIWSVDRDRGVVVAGVKQSGFDRLLATGYEIEIDHALTGRGCASRPPAKDGESGIPGFSCYSTVEETYARAEALVAEHPQLVEWVDVGDSWAKIENPATGYDLMVLKLANQETPGTGTTADPGAKPRLFAMASLHAREYATAELLIRFAEGLLASYGRDADTTWLLDEHEIHLLLYANPDGRKQAEAGFLWRKNVDNEFCSDTSSRGVDLNRNFEYQWGCCSGSSSDECSELFRGPEAVSEPETQVIQSYAREIFPAQWDPVPAADATGIFLDVHSYGRLVIWPWGYADDVAPNSDALTTLGRKLAYFNYYSPEQAIDFYPTDGTTTDFSYGDLGVASYTVELGTYFFQPCEYFEEQILEQNLAMLFFAAKAVRAPYLLPAGPEISSLTILPQAAVPVGSEVELRALADDTRFRLTWPSEAVQHIATVELSVDVPPWRLPAPDKVILQPVDGALDSAREELRATIYTGGLEPGRHILYVQAQDEAGNWGVVSATFLDVGVYADGVVRHGGGRFSP